MEALRPVTEVGWTRRARVLLLLALVMATTAARLWIIVHFPEPDGDAKGHLGIARAVLADPLNVALHWVWPPGYHFFLAGLLAAGFSDDGVRVLNCLLAVGLPFLLWAYGERTLAADASDATRQAPYLAALLCAAMPIVNLLGTSAQQETLFTLIVVAAAWAIDGSRFVAAGALLAIATTIRYEAWGGVGLLASLRVAGYLPAIRRRLPAELARASSLPLVVTVTPLLAIGAWFLAHRVADGSFFGFIWEIHRYTQLQRESFHQSLWTQILWFPIREPLFLFGLAIPLFFVGARRAFRAGFVVPAGIYLFLLVSYLGKGVLGSARYYESLTPFFCLAATHGAALIGERWRRAMPVAFAAAFAHVLWLLVLTGRWTFHLPV